MKQTEVITSDHLYYTMDNYRADNNGKLELICILKLDFLRVFINDANNTFNKLFLFLYVYQL